MKGTFYQISDLMHHLLETTKFHLDRPYLDIHGGLEIHERWRRLRANYATHEVMVKKGLSDWMSGDPYSIADWMNLFTPIEEAAWSEIRYRGLPLWPQLPVGPFLVDFGNPVLKIALECDGAQWHNARKDSARDTWLNSKGWRVFRAPGWLCMRDTTPADPSNPDEYSREEREWELQTKTLVGVMDEMRRYMPEAA